MKKYLVVLLALAMVFAFATTAFAADEVIPDYTDVKADTEYANDIYRLTALGVLQGNNGWGGAYRPAEYLTRAEFAKIAVYMYGIEDTVNYYASLKSSFNDVAEGFWAEGYINAALDNGLMKGRGNGVFDPQSTVTTQEVATVVLRAVGYTDELPGAWPTDYITKATNASAWWDEDGTLFDYVDFIGPNAATRGEMAAIVNYALDMYKVTYVKDNYTLVYSVSDVDNDGYAYDQWKTNEEQYFKRVLGIWDPDYKEWAQKVTLLWNVFNAYSFPTRFEAWSDYDTTGPSFKLAEAGGWGYEDFEDGELQFILDDYDYTVELQFILNDYDYTVELPVATNYYIFDTSLDGELWQLAARSAFVTVKVTSIANDEEEALYVDLKTDVVYSDDDKAIVANYDGAMAAVYGDDPAEDVDNANIYTDAFDKKAWNEADFAYDYNLYKDMPFAIVAEIEDDLVELHYDAAYLGENGVFCLLDDCKKHDLDFLILKDGELGDADLLEVNDIVYYAGTLYGDGTGHDTDYEGVELFIAYSPVKADFTKLYAATNYKMQLSGEDYTYVTTDGALASYDNGDRFKNLSYTDLLEVLEDDDFEGDVLFAEAYAKTWVGELIFDYEQDDNNYGVITKLNIEWLYKAGSYEYADASKTLYSVDDAAPFAPLTDLSSLAGYDANATEYLTMISEITYTADGNEADDHDKDSVINAIKYAYIPVYTSYNGTGAWYYTGATFFGPDGEKHTYDFNREVLISTDPTNPDVISDDTVRALGFAEGDLVTYTLKSGDVVLEKMGAKDYKYGYLAGKVDFLPADVYDDMVTDDEGFFDTDKTTPQYPIEWDWSKVRYSNFFIDEETIVFEVTSKIVGGQRVFSKVALGDAADYIDASTEVRQYAIFSADAGKDLKDNRVKVLYLVDPDVVAGPTYGLVTEHAADGERYVIVNGERLVVSGDDFDLMPSNELFYVGYVTADGEAYDITYPGSSASYCSSTIQKGDLVVLVDSKGFGCADAKSLLDDVLDDYSNVSDVIEARRVGNRFATDCQFIDMTGDGDFDSQYDFNHDDEDYRYITISNGSGRIGMIFRVEK